MKVAVPSEAPGGLDANVSAHFGHCEMYTVVDIEDNEIKNISVLPNVPHEGCQAVVDFIATNKINVMLAKGMGGRPFAGFCNLGIKVLFCDDNISKSKDAFEAYIAGNMEEFSMNNTCQH